MVVGSAEYFLPRVVKHRADSVSSKVAEQVGCVPQSTSNWKITRQVDRWRFFGWTFEPILWYIVLIPWKRISYVFTYTTDTLRLNPRYFFSVSFSCSTFSRAQYFTDFFPSSSPHISYAGLISRRCSAAMCRLCRRNPISGYVDVRRIGYVCMYINCKNVVSSTPKYMYS